MRRYHEEKHIIENRVKQRRQLDFAFDVNPDYAPEPGRFRKSLRCSGCGRARCQVCHSDKFPKRKLTKKEIQSKKDFNEQQKEL